MMMMMMIFVTASWTNTSIKKSFQNVPISIDDKIHIWVPKPQMCGGGMNIDIWGSDPLPLMYFGIDPV